MGEMHEMYGAWDSGEYNPLEGDADPGEICVNCGGEFASPVPRLFCSVLCQDEAKLVRYVRRCSADGRSAGDEVQEAIEIRMAREGTRDGLSLDWSANYNGSDPL